MKRTLLLASLLALTGCQRSDGDRLAGIGRAVTRNAEQLIPNRSPIGSGLTLHVGADQRVRDRFKTDRYLNAQAIEVTAEGGSVRLKGIVAEQALKLRAVEMAESTIGVEQVVDELMLAK